MGQSPEAFVLPELLASQCELESDEIPLPEAIEAKLRQDRVLPITTVNAISEMLRVAYRAAGAASSRQQV
jgi:hypothetical protein